MKTYILDTNILIRFIVGDNILHQQQAQRWFQEASRGAIEIIITPTIIAEATFVLQSFYKHSRDVISDAMEVFLSQRWLAVHEREILLDLWQHYREGLHFVDSYLLARAQSEKIDILSFDKKLKKRLR